MSSVCLHSKLPDSSTVCLLFGQLYIYKSAVCLHCQLFVYIVVNCLFTFQLSVWLLEFCVFPPVGTTKMSVEFAAKRPKITALAFVALDGPLLWPLYAS